MTKMNKNKTRLAIIFLYFVVFFVVCLFYSTGTLSLTIGSATPFTVLPLLTAYSLFSTPQKSALAGLLVGIFLDSSAGNTYCFNAIVLLLISLFVCLTANNLFNKNLRATFVISLLSAIVYFLAFWAVFFIYRYNIKDSLTYLINIGFPSAVYTSVFIFPFYFLFRFFEKIK